MFALPSSETQYTALPADAGITETAHDKGKTLLECQETLTSITMSQIVLFF